MFKTVYLSLILLRLKKKKKEEALKAPFLQGYIFASPVIVDKLLNCLCFKGGNINKALAQGLVLRKCSIHVGCYQSTATITQVFKVDLKK